MPGLAAAAVLAAGCGDEDGRGDGAPASPPASPPVTRPAGAVWCPANERGTFDARALLGLTEARARAEAERAGCALRVVARDGEALVVTEDLRTDRINVEVVDDVVVALAGVG